MRLAVLVVGLCICLGCSLGDRVAALSLEEFRNQVSDYATSALTTANDVYKGLPAWNQVSDYATSALTTANDICNGLSSRISEKIQDTSSSSSSSTTNQAFRKVRPNDVLRGTAAPGSTLGSAVALGGGVGYLASLGITWTASALTPTLMSAWGGAVAAGSWTAFIQSVGAGATFLGGPIVWGVVGAAVAVGGTAYYLSEDSNPGYDAMQTLVINGDGGERFEEWLTRTKKVLVVHVAPGFWKPRVTTAVVQTEPEVKVTVEGDDVDAAIDVWLRILL